MDIKPCHLAGQKLNPPQSSIELRPTPMFSCTYDEQSVRQRISTFFDVSKGIDAEGVATALGMPVLTSAFDDPRTADYSAIVAGAGGWTLFLSVTERFYPLHSGPPQFIPGPHPKRLGRPGDSWKQLVITFEIPAIENRSPQDCNIIYPYFDTAGMAGWVYDSRGGFASEGHKPPISMVGPNGRGFSVDLDDSEACRATLLFTEGHNPNPWD